MRPYFSRLWWYIAVACFAVSAYVLPTKFMINGLLDALLFYLPVSLLWVFISAALYKHYGYSEKIFGMPSDRVGYGILGTGIFLIASYIVLWQIDVAKLGFTLAFSGVDWILTLREGKERGRCNPTEHRS